MGQDHRKPLYSPDLNPISRKRIRQAKGAAAAAHRPGARTREALIEAMGRALEAVS
jgi:hypothetical protein